MRSHLIILLTWTWALAIAAATIAQPATAPSSAPAGAQVALQVASEEGKKSIQATVTAAGKPVENATVAFFIKRTFGDLLLGQDKTLDDGTAAVPFPADLVGDEQGQLLVLARVTGPAPFTGSQGTAVVAGGQRPAHSTESFPRALWAPRAPVLLIFTVFGILGAVWCCYAYVFFQVWSLSRRRNL